MLVFVLENKNWSKNQISAINIRIHFFLKLVIPTKNMFCHITCMKVKRFLFFINPLGIIFIFRKRLHCGVVVSSFS